MTKFERVKNKKLVDELRQRRQQGELNLIIINGSIVEHQPRPPGTTNKTVSVPRNINKPPSIYTITCVNRSGWSDFLTTQRRDRPK